MDINTCPNCGARANCNCYVRAGERAAAAVLADPDLSDRDIAIKIGVSPMTVGRARKESGVTNVTPEKRIGRDGKTYRSHKKKAKAKQVDATTLVSTPGKPVKLQHAREIVRPLVRAGKPINAKKLSGQYSGLSHDIFEKAAIAERVVLETLKVDFASLPDRDRFDVALAQERARMEATFALRVDKAAAEHIRNMMMHDADTNSVAQDPLAVRWENSLGGVAGYAIALEAYWDQMLPGWRDCSVSESAVTLSRQAADAWYKINSTLQQRRGK